MLPILLLGIGLLIGCADEAPQVERSSGASASADADLCAEHGVLEAVCTKCNPSLIPVFQANGDWCDEHGFPESFCPICSPEQGGRPLVADVTDDGSVPDGTVVRFRTRQAAEQAGIEVSAAVEVPWASATTAVARLAWDATQVALVGTRTAGVVVGIQADVGTVVEEGTALASLRSAHVGGDRSRIVAARRSVEVAQAELTRKRALLEVGVTSHSQVLTAEQALSAAQAHLGSLSAELGLVGSGVGDGYTVRSPIAGVITERHANIGQSVDPATTIFVVVDASRMWAELDVSEGDLASVRVGQPVRLRFDAAPAAEVVGSIAYLAPSVDPQTRTTLARVVVDNPDGVLRANMYGVAHIVTEQQDAVVAVPSSAVQRAGKVSLVFVKQGDDTFVARRVRVVGRSGDQVRIAGPIEPGDPVATVGSFLLKTETLKDSIGAGCCDVE